MLTHIIKSLKSITLENKSQIENKNEKISNEINIPNLSKNLSETEKVFFFFF